MEGPSRVLSRSGKDLGSFANLDEDEVDMLLDDSYAEASSVADLLQECPSVTPLDAGGSSRDSQSEALSLEMEAALRAALASRTLTPLLKEELRCKIQLKRLQRGKEEITPDFSIKSSAMSMEEVVKKNRKMEQNRMSAQRSRNRQKSLEKSIKSRLDMLEKQNTWLAEQAQSLRHACQVARDWLQQHRSCAEHSKDLATSGGAASSLVLPVLTPGSPGSSSSSSSSSRLNSDSSSSSSFGDMSART